MQICQLIKEKMKIHKKAPQTANKNKAEPMFP